MKNIFIALIIVVFALSSCDMPDADVASYNLSKEADQFNIRRRVVFYNGITGEYILSVDGFCSIEYDSMDNQLELTVKTGENSYKKHYLGLSDNVTYFAEQLDSANVSTYHYKVIFKPKAIVPDIDLVN